MPKQTAATARVAARRRQVAHLLLERHTQQEIAARLQVTQSTVSADIQAIRAGWTAEDHPHIRELVDQERRVLDADEVAWRECLQTALKADVSLAVRIYDRCIAPIGDRRAHLLGMLPPPKESGTALTELDQLLDSLGLGLDSPPAAPAPRPPAGPPAAAEGSPP